MDKPKVLIELSPQATVRLQNVAALLMCHDYSLLEEIESYLQVLCSEHPEIEVVVRNFREMAA